tara:strand:+ start:274 stop:396 length:123 start_codon:yes stop_codon:yes gene_type:complete
MTITELWQEANAANREYLAGLLSWKDFMSIIHDLAEAAKC